MPHFSLFANGEVWKRPEFWDFWGICVYLLKYVLRIVSVRKVCHGILRFGLVVLMPVLDLAIIHIRLQSRF